MENKSGKRLQTIMKKIVDLVNDNDEEFIDLDDDKLTKLVLNKLCHDKTTVIIEAPETKKKCPVLSSYYKLQGSYYFSSKPDENYLNTSFDLCTKSIAFAPIKSKELSLAYDARSLIFLKAKLIKECLIDIDHALEIVDCPETVKSNLYLRKAMCLRILEQPEQLIYQAFEDARGWVKKLEQNEQSIMIEEIDKEEKNQLIDKSMYYEAEYDHSIFKINNENPIFPGTSDAIELVYNKKYGRHIIAARDIKPGETLMVHKPYVSVLLKEQFRYEYCWHCKQQTWTSIPCDKCTNIVFCSINCKDESIKLYHDYECAVLDAMSTYDMDTSFLIDLQLAIKGWKESECSFDEFMKVVDNIDSQPESLTKGFTNNKLDPTKFSSIYSMTRNLNCDRSTKCCYLANNILTAYLMATKTDYLGKKMDDDLGQLSEDPRFINLTKLLLKIAYLTDINSHELLAFKAGEEISIIHTILPLAFSNHTCFRMITKIFTNGFVIVKSVLPIKKNEQIYDNYGPSCFENERNQRQAHLLRHYNFTCECVACKNEWSLKYIDEDLPSHIETQYHKMNNDFIQILENSKKLIQSHYSNYYYKNNDSQGNLKLLHDETQNIVKIIEFCYDNRQKNSSELNNATDCLKSLIRLNQKPHVSMSDITS